MSNVGRCQSCGHPLAQGEWTRCDTECRHGGERMWLFDAYRGRTLVQARGRARAEERDCPECDGDGWVLHADDILSLPRPGETGSPPDPDCPTCSGSGRVRPLLCQACERSET